MQDSTRVSVPSQARPATVHPRRLGSADDSFEDSNPDTQSSVHVHDSVALECPAVQTEIHIEHADPERNDESETDSAEAFSACVSHNRHGRFDGTGEPQCNLPSSSSCLTLERKEFSRFSRQRHFSILRGWKWEILSVLASLGLLTGILTTLGRYNDGKQPEWPYNININSLISVLTAVIIAQLGFILAEGHYTFGFISQLKWSWFREPHPLQDFEHYDAASRGLLGSLIFLSRFIRQPRAYHAVGAALILLMSAAIGPFTQQSIKTYACQRPLHNVSALMPTASYVNSSLTVGGESMNLLYPHLNMMTAALEGIVGSATNSKTVPFDCPTGDCDFAPYSSLGYCSSCTDITSRVQERLDPLYLESGVIHTWNYTVPGQDCRLSFKSVDGLPALGTDWFSGVTRDHLMLCPWGQSFQIYPRRSATSFMVMSLSRATCSHNQLVSDPKRSDCVNRPEQLPSLSNLSGLVAVNCTLGLCVRDYTSRVRNGELHETMTSNLALNLLPAEQSTDMFKILKLPCTVDSNKYDISNISQVSSTPGRRFTTVILDGRNITAPLECVFATDAALPISIGHFFQNGLLQPKNRGQSDRGATCSINSLDGSSFCDPWYLEPLFRGGSPTVATISSVMDGITVGISNQMRAVGSNAYGDGSGVVVGTAIQTTVCVRVDWPWLLFPAALVLLTVVLFVAVLIKARHSEVADGQPVWKSSAIVAFFHGIDGKSRKPDCEIRDTTRVNSSHDQENNPDSVSSPRGEGHQDLMTLERMHAKARKVVVKLETAAPGHRGFVVVNEEDDDQVGSNKQKKQRSATDSLRNGERLPLHRVSSNIRLHEQSTILSHVDLGNGLPPSVRGSINRSFRNGLQDGPERET